MRVDGFSRGSGNTIIGTEALAKSPPDGYTIALVTPNLAILPHRYRALPYDTLRDIAPVAAVSISSRPPVVHPSVPANNLQEFIALARDLFLALDDDSQAWYRRSGTSFDDL